MTANRKPTGTAVGIPTGMIVGTLSAIIMTLAGVLATAKMVDMQRLEWDKVGYGVMATLLIASWTGAMISAGMIKRRRMTACLLTGGCYLTTLLIITGLFFGGQYSGVGETGLLILCGSMLGVLSGNGRKKGRKTRKIRLTSC